MTAEERSLEDEIADRTGLPVEVITAVVEEALVNQLDRFRRGALFTFDDPGEEDLAALSTACGQTKVVVREVLLALGDAAEDLVPDEIVDGEG